MVDFIATLTSGFDLSSVGRAVRILLILLVIFGIFRSVLAIINHNLLKKTKTKKHVTNIKIFSRVLQITVIVILVMFGIFSYAGSWTGFGVGLGLLSAALGWALQKPITGLAAWIMIVLKRPFEIGDRIMIGGMKGDVTDITLTHIYIHEAGGIIEKGEEISGRTIMIPNAIMFEQNIINYTADDEFVLGEVDVLITYESDLEKAIKVILGVANKITAEVSHITKKKPYIRTHFDINGIKVFVRFQVHAKRVQETVSDITRGVYDAFAKESDISFAYPHTEFVSKEKISLKK